MTTAPSTMNGKVSTAIALPDNVRRAALAYPGKVKAELTIFTSSDEALMQLRAGDGWLKLCRDYGADTETLNAVQRGRLYIQAQLGEMMPPEKGGRGKKKLGDQGAGFSHDSLARFRKVAKSSDEIDPYVDSANESSEPIETSTAGFINWVGSGGNIASKFTGEVEWYTPAEYVKPAAHVMGGIDLDPASCKAAQKVVGAAKYYTAEDDGLSQEWAGRVFLNPPFKMPLVKQFVFKLCEHVAAKEVSQAVLLTNNNTDTAWWHRAANLANVICFTKGRISFYNAAGVHSSPTNGQTLMYFGERRKAFSQAYNGLGFCLER